MRNSRASGTRFPPCRGSREGRRARGPVRGAATEGGAATDRTAADPPNPACRYSWLGQGHAALVLVAAGIRFLRRRSQCLQDDLAEPVADGHLDRLVAGVQAPYGEIAPEARIDLPEGRDDASPRVA